MSYEKMAQTLYAENKTLRAERDAAAKKIRLLVADCARAETERDAAREALREATEWRGMATAQGEGTIVVQFRCVRTGEQFVEACKREGMGWYGSEYYPASLFTALGWLPLPTVPENGVAP